MKIKNQRINTIVRLIENNKVGSQDTLLSLLEGEGYKTTQATLSRDLKSLKVAKRPDKDNGYIYVLPDDRIEEEGLVSSQGDFPLSGLLSVEFSQNLAVIKTRPGFANGIASVIDSHGPFEVLGTIAGDDTILLISRENVGVAQVLDALSFIIPGIKEKVVS